MKVLVTGGAGYIGNFMTRRLLNDGYDVVVVDSLERGHKELVDNRVEFYTGNLLDKSFLTKVFSSHVFDAVFHFAAYISMGESMKHPGIYFQNNTIATVQLLDVMHEFNVRNIIFSSTAGVYGNPLTVPIPEDHQKRPENPYGESKLLVEQIIRWYESIHRIQYVCLRYFNAAGASLNGEIGEAHTPETHIIPNVIRAVIDDQPFTLYGTDYDTPDGTCIRDYIHVLDLAEAHIRALKYVKDHPGGYTFNVGTGRGYSNKEIIDAVQKVAGKSITINSGPRRLGDAAVLVADATNIKQQLGFVPQYSELETIVTSAWRWHTKQEHESN
jgi:UDP-glucose 4-epimerase